MRITKFWAKGYRSLKDVTLDAMGPFNVFYGPNGSGKSNVLAAIEAFMKALRLIAGDEHAYLLNVHSASVQGHRKHARLCGGVAAERGVFNSRDFCIDAKLRTLTLGASIATQGDGGGAGHAIEAEVTFDEVVAGQFRLWLTELRIDGVAPPALLADGGFGVDECRALFDAMASEFLLLDAVRAPRREVTTATPDGEEPLWFHLREGRLKNALFIAQNSPDAAVRGRFRALQKLLEGEPLRRPRFDAVQDPKTQEVDVREPLGSGDVPLDRLGLGVAQVYALLAGVLLSNGRAVAVEEPEAHLHAPTLGRAVRALLLRLVHEGSLDQLFLATHSNLFDLDPDGYWDVSFVDGETRVARKPLHEIDRHHLWETGPTRHALELLLDRGPPDRVVFRHADGRPIIASQMLHYLRDDDDITKRFLDDLHGAALDMMRIENERGRAR